MKKSQNTSYRQDRVAHLVQTTLMNILRNGRALDMRLIPCPLSITYVKISPDLKIATCYFSPFNTRLSTDEILDALHTSSRSLRLILTKEINLKYSPELRFFYDNSFDNALKVESLLQMPVTTKERN